MSGEHNKPQQRTCLQPVSSLKQELISSAVMDDLSSLLNSARDLTAHVARQDLPQINLSLEQIEAQSRRLVSRQQGAAADSGKG